MQRPASLVEPLAFVNLKCKVRRALTTVKEVVRLGRVFSSLESEEPFRLLSCHRIIVFDDELVLVEPMPKSLTTHSQELTFLPRDDLHIFSLY